MVISFSSDKARTFLLKNGFVYTYRKNRRKQFQKLSRDDQLKRLSLLDWANEGRLKKKFSDVLINEICECTPSRLTHYVNWSGFKNWREWYDEIQRMNNWNFPLTNLGWLYRVALYNTKTKQSSEGTVK